MVISQKMIENEMEYRGSNSDLKSVKEQRVDGSWYFLYNKKCLRCTLMGFERNYQVKIPSNQINLIRTYASSATHKPLILNNSVINPWFLTGFADAEASFSILIQPNDKHKTGWTIKAIFSIGLHLKDTELLEKIQSYLGVSILCKHSRDSVQYRAESINDLKVVIDHFDKYPLVSAKKVDYILFKKAFYTINTKEHLTKQGLLKLVGIKSSLNLGLSAALKKAFPSWQEKQVIRPEYIFNGIPDPNWIAGFSSGDGSFNIKISSSTTTKTGKKVQLRFTIGLNIREKDLIRSLAAYFNLKNSEQNKLNTESKKISYIYFGENSVSVQVIKFQDIYKIIIPFFNKYPIQGQKSLDLAY